MTSDSTVSFLRSSRVMQSICKVTGNTTTEKNLFTFTVCQQSSQALFHLIISADLHLNVYYRKFPDLFLDRYREGDTKFEGRGWLPETFGCSITTENCMVTKTAFQKSQLSIFCIIKRFTEYQHLISRSSVPTFSNQMPRS